MRRSLVAIALVTLITAPLLAQAPAATGGRPDLPAVGEEFTYAVDYTGVVGAYIKVKVGEGPPAQPGSRVLTAYVASTPLIQNIWRIRDKIMTLYLPHEGRTAATRLWEDENGKRMFREEKFNPRKIKVVEKRADNSRDFEIKTEEPLLDGFTALFELRRRPLVDGTVEPARIYLNRKIYDCQAQVTRETITYRGEELRAIRVDPVLTHKGKSVENVGFTFWLSDDHARVPVRIEADVRYGKLAGTLLPADKGQAEGAEPPDAAPATEAAQPG